MSKDNATKSADEETEVQRLQYHNGGAKELGGQHYPQLPAEHDFECA